MLRSLLVALDGSDLAEQSVPFAARLATDGNSRLVLVHVRTPCADTGAREYELAAVAERVRADGAPAESECSTSTIMTWAGPSAWRPANS